MGGAEATRRRRRGFRVPLAYLLGHMLGWGSIEVYVGMGISSILCAVLMIAMFLSGGWANAIIQTFSDEEAARQAERGAEEPGVS